mgnify:FL=1
MNDRTRLPNRRPSINRKVVWQTDTAEHRFYVTLGLHPATGDVLEVFYADGQLTGSQLQHTIQDACVLISLLLQHGVSSTDIGKSLSTAPVFGQDRPATVVGVIAETLKDGLEGVAA